MKAARFSLAVAILLAACAPPHDDRARIPLDDASAASPAVVVHAQGEESYTSEYLAQRFVIAERDPGAVHAPFRSAYTAIGNDASDWAVISTPALFLRMGPRRLLALHTWTGHPDGGGGAFIARVAPGRWSTVAGWAVGC